MIGQYTPLHTHMHVHDMPVHVHELHDFVYAMLKHIYT